MLEWFNNIDNIKNKCFVNFDIVNFYPSISHERVSKAIKFAKNFTEVKKRRHKANRAHMQNNFHL